MNRKIRDILFYIFIVIFLILTFLVSLYAAGYKLTLSWPLKLSNLLLKTSTLEISTSPKGASIFLEKEQKTFLVSQDKYLGENTSPAKINQLLPGTYNLRLELEGYWPWENKIRLDSGKALYINNLILFKKTLPLVLYSSLVQEITLSSDNNYLLLPFSKKIINLKQNIAINLPEDNIDTWRFSADNQNFITNKYIFNLNTKELIFFKQNENKPLSNLKCTANRRLSFYQVDNDIFELNLETQTENKLISLNSCQDYLIQDNYIYTLESYEQKSYLKKYSSKGEFLNSLELPYNLNYEFLNLDNQYINIVQKDYQQLYIIDLNSQYKPIKASLNNFKIGTWQKNNELIYANDYEIYSYNLNFDTFKLITRTGEKIKHLMWHPDRDYIAYATKDSFYIINWQSQGYTTTKILSLQEIKSPKLDIKNNQIYFSGRIGQQSGVYKLSVQ